MSKQVALVTGANKGIGLETARQLGQKGIRVILGSRSLQAGEAAATQLRQEGIDAVSLQLDVNDEASIEAATTQVTERFGALDILVNNAGIMRDVFDKAPSEQALPMWRETFETNLFGLVAVTKAMLPLIRASTAGRIVNVSSVLGSMAANIDPQSAFYSFKIPAYNISKTALNAWTVHLAYELRDTAIKVNAAHPGFVKTDLHGVDAPLDATQGARTSVRLATLASDGPTGGFFHDNQAVAW